MHRTPRRRVDWRLTAGDDPRRARLVSPSTQSSALAQITSALLADPSAQTVDQVLRVSVEFARGVLHLERAAIFLVGPEQGSTQGTMIGTWGTDADGRTTDEHDIAFELDDIGRQFFARASHGYLWSVYEDCPHMTHVNGQTQVFGRGWLACTAILGSERPLGILFNDTALTGARFDEAKQARAAVLCSLLGRALDRSRALFFEGEFEAEAPTHPLVQEASRLLAGDPSLSFEEVARRLDVSKGHLTRTFKRFTEESIVDYRNELRLAQFLSHVNTGSDALLEAALGAGFGSYAQFHRVFRSRFGKAPRAYLYEQSTGH